MLKKLKSDKGFTLVEVMVVVALLTMVIYAAYTVFSFGFISFQEGESKAREQADARIVAQHINRSIRGADQIRLSNDPPDNSGDWEYIALENNNNGNGAVHLNGAEDRLNIDKLEFAEDNGLIKYTVEAGSYQITSTVKPVYEGTDINNGENEGNGNGNNESETYYSVLMYQVKE